MNVAMTTRQGLLSIVHVLPLLFVSAMKAEVFPAAGKMVGSAGVLCCVLLASSMQAGQPPWVLTKTTTSGQIYHREIPGSSIPWVKIVTEYAAPPARIHAMVTDYDRFAAFVPNVTVSRVVLTEGSDQWVYHHLHFPGPVADRVYLIKSTDRTSRPEKGYYRVAWNLADRVIPDVDLTTGIRPDAFSGYWEIHPGKSAGFTEAHYAIFSDPGGFIPDWLFVKKADRYVQQVVEAFRERLATE